MTSSSHAAPRAPLASAARVFCLALLGLASPCAGQDLVVHPSVAASAVSRNDTRLYFTMRIKEWPDGTSVKVFSLPDNHPTHERFAKAVLGLFPYQLRRLWDRQVFSGTGQAPVAVQSEQELAERVAETPGAIGYVEHGAIHRGVRVMEIR